MWLVNHLNGDKWAAHGKKTTSDPRKSRENRFFLIDCALYQRGRLTAILDPVWLDRLSRSRSMDSLTRGRKKPEPLAFADQSVKLSNLTCISDKKPRPASQQHQTDQSHAYVTYKTTTLATPLFPLGYRLAARTCTSCTCNLPLPSFRKHKRVRRSPFQASTESKLTPPAPSVSLIN